MRGVIERFSIFPFPSSISSELVIGVRSFLRQRRSERFRERGGTLPAALVAISLGTGGSREEAVGECDDACDGRGGEVIGADRELGRHGQGQLWIPVAAGVDDLGRGAF